MTLPVPHSVVGATSSASYICPTCRTTLAPPSLSSTVNRDLLDQTTRFQASVDQFTRPLAQ